MLCAMVRDSVSFEKGVHPPNKNSKGARVVRVKYPEEAPNVRMFPP